VRSRGDLALAVASSGVAALLMPGGQTGNSLYKIPLKVYEYSNMLYNEVIALCKNAEEGKSYHMG
jgi:hypothetical protein